VAQENVPQLKWLQVMEQEGKDALNKHEHLWAKDARTAYGYAAHIDRPFPAGEKVISSNAKLSFRYAINILGKKPFPAGEKAIAADAKYSYLYAFQVLNDRFPAGEEAISKDAQYRNKYEKAFNVKL